MINGVLFPHSTALFQVPYISACFCPFRFFIWTIIFFLISLPIWSQHSWRMADLYKVMLCFVYLSSTSAERGSNHVPYTGVWYWWSRICIHTVGLVMIQMIWRCILEIKRTFYRQNVPVSMFASCFALPLTPSIWFCIMYEIYGPFSTNILHIFIVCFIL